MYICETQRHRERGRERERERVRVRVRVREMQREREIEREIERESVCVCLWCVWVWVCTPKAPPQDSQPQFSKSTWFCTLDNNGLGGVCDLGIRVSGVFVGFPKA